MEMKDIRLTREASGRYLVLDANTGTVLGRVAKRDNEGWRAYFQDYNFGQPAARMRWIGVTFQTRREAVSEIKVELAGEV